MHFPHKSFTKAFSSWLQKELNELSELEEDTFPHEGIGCWNPVFPA
jgi:hypothetical protein